MPPLVLVQEEEGGAQDGDVCNWLEDFLKIFVLTKELELGRSLHIWNRLSRKFI